MAIGGAVDNEGELVAFHANLSVSGAVTGAGSANIVGATLSFGSSFSQQVRFEAADPSGELVLAQSQGYGAKIHNFSASGTTTLDLKDIGFVSADEASFSKGVLTVSDGAHTAHIHLSGSFTGVTFTAATDGAGGTLITASATPGPALAQAGRLVSAMAAMSAPAAMSSSPATEGVRTRLAAIAAPAS
jgi:hypothetical protein